MCLGTQSHPTLCDPMDCSLPGSSVHGDPPRKNTGVGCFVLLQGSSQPRDRTQVSCIAGRFFTVWAIREAPCHLCLVSNVSSLAKHLNQRIVIAALPPPSWDHLVTLFTFTLLHFFKAHLSIWKSVSSHIYLFSDSSNSNVRPKSTHFVSLHLFQILEISSLHWGTPLHIPILAPFMGLL